MLYRQILYITLYRQIDIDLYRIYKTTFFWMSNINTKAREKKIYMYVTLQMPSNMSKFAFPFKLYVHFKVNSYMSTSILIYI